MNKAIIGLDADEIIARASDSRAVSITLAGTSKSTVLYVSAVVPLVSAELRGIQIAENANLKGS
ncbi:MAG TPA: hypothetical protein VG297_02425 [Bryobacteraceae bacterium]|nr:hypothetical protein [Bryobacteraceae bacterium]